MELILVRHPRPLAPPDACYGGTDVPVAAEELDRVYAALAGAGLPGTAPVYCSPLQRCVQLARRLAPAPIVDADLAEMRFGAWEMRGWADIGHAEVDAWAADLLRYRPGGGETVLEVAHRVRRALDRIRADNATRAVVVCHAGTIRLLVTLAQGIGVEQAALAAAAAPHRIGYGEALRVVTSAKAA